MMDSTGLAVLTTAECMRLLATAPVGRVVFTDRALPAVQPVNFALYEDAIVFRTGPGSKLSAIADSSIVGFEVDDIDVKQKTGWSVTVIGRVTEINDPGDLAAARELPIEPWAPGHRDHYVRIQVEHVTGGVSTSQNRRGTSHREQSLVGPGPIGVGRGGRRMTWFIGFSGHLGVVFKASGNSTTSTFEMSATPGTTPEWVSHVCS